MRRIAGKMGMLAAVAAFVLQFQVVNCAVKTSAETVIGQETQIDVLQSASAQPAKANNLAGRKFILLGDSYGDGWTPERMEVSWMARVKSALGSENVYTCSEGGTGFCGYNLHHTTYITLLQRVLPSIPDLLKVLSAFRFQAYSNKMSRLGYTTYFPLFLNRITPHELKKNNSRCTLFCVFSSPRKYAISIINTNTI